MTASSPLVQSLEPMFRPKSVAIIGASSQPFKQGNAAVKYLVAGGFTGAIYPINPGGGEIEGIRAFASILDVPGQVDCALFVIPAAATAGALKQCAQKGVRAAILGNNGFSELGTDAGRARQDEVTRIAREHGIRVLGPNTNGIWNADAKFSLGYNTSHGDPATPGPVSIAAHSGALFNSIAPALRAFGTCLSKFVPVGNEADTDILDYLEFFIADPDTKVIGLIVEGVRDGERLRALAKSAQAAGKPVIALKLGRSAAGASAAMAHSSRLAGSARAYDALFEGCGILRARSIESLAGACALLAGGAPKAGGGNFDLVSVSTSGGGAELVADHAADYGIRLAGNADGTWGGAAAPVIETFEGAGLIRNPVDGGNLAGWGNLEKLFAAIEGDGFNGPVLLFSHMLPQERGDRQVADMLLARRERTGAPVFCVAPGGVRTSIGALFAGAGVPVFRDLGTCFDSLKCYYEALKASTEAVGESGFGVFEAGAPELPDGERGAIAALIAQAGGKTLLNEVESARILAAAAVPMVVNVAVASAAQALDEFKRAGGSIVLKGIAPGIAHKNDAGLVAAGLATAADVERAFGEIEAGFARLRVDRAACSIIAQPMIASRAELICGVAYEPPLGHFLVVGLGGIYAEALDEVKLIAIPALPAAIAAAIEESKLGVLLQKLNLTAPGRLTHVERLTGVLCALQGIALAFPDRIQSIEVNPLLVGKDMCMAVDALIELRGGG